METTERAEIMAELKTLSTQMQRMRELILNATNEMAGVASQIARIRSSLGYRVDCDCNGRYTNVDDCRARYNQTLIVALRIFDIKRIDYEKNMNYRGLKYIFIRQAIVGILHFDWNFSTRAISEVMGKERTSPNHTAKKHLEDSVNNHEYNLKCAKIRAELFPEKNNVGNV